MPSPPPAYMVQKDSSPNGVNLPEFYFSTRELSFVTCGVMVVECGDQMEIIPSKEG